MVVRSSTGFMVRFPALPESHKNESIPKVKEGVHARDPFGRSYHDHLLPCA